MRRTNWSVGVFVGGVILGAVTGVQAADWPQWRGPQRDGVSQEKGLLQKWPQGGPKLLWQVKDVGEGYSTPSIVGERLYLLSSKGTADEFVQARAVKDGQQLWSTRIGKVGNPEQRPAYPAARSTPTVDGEWLYALGSDGDLVCLETATGKIRWQKQVRSDFHGAPGTWAYAESPLLDGDVLVCTPGGSEATLVALNKQTGDVIWKSAVPGGDPAGYASIVITAVGGQKQYVQFLGKGLVGVEAKTGKFLWRYERTGAGPANMPTPVAHGEFVYSAAGRTGGALVKLTADGGQVTAQELYFSNTLPTAIGGTVRLGDYLYGANSQAFLCVNFLDGQVKWQDRSVGAGSVCYADNRLYIHGENGDVALLAATPEAYQEQGRLALPEQPDRGRSKAWAYPAVANGRFYIRDLGTLWCYDIQAPVAK